MEEVMGEIVSISRYRRLPYKRLLFMFRNQKIPDDCYVTDPKTGETNINPALHYWADLFFEEFWRTPLDLDEQD
jgi:hypothetical protein